MTDWMQALAEQYRSARQRCPDDDLVLVFDIDDTILDMRHMVRHVLLEYDRVHATRFFYGLAVEDLERHDNRIEKLLEGFDVPSAAGGSILEWCRSRSWSHQAVLASHRPFRGVLEIIRWFQLQPGTRVGLNTGRTERLRQETLDCLNALGSEYRVVFDSDLLYMRPHRDMSILDAKAEGIRWFREQGHRVFAVVDNEPENIAAMAAADPDGEILFMHADTLFASQRRELPRTVSGTDYDITRLIPDGGGLPSHVQFVWHGVNDLANLRRFLASPVSWGESDVRRDPLDRLVLRDDSFETSSWNRDEDLLTLDECLRQYRYADKGIKLDLKEGGETVTRVLELLRTHGVDTKRVWFNGSLANLASEDFTRLAKACPDAVIQCSVGFMAPLVKAVPEKAREILETMRGWGVNRFSIDWRIECRARMFEQLDAWGCEVNFYNVPDLAGFLRAALLLPKSLTADFNFPEWNFFGRGSGKGGVHHEYRRSG